jgi:Zn-dependent protease
MFRTLHLGQLSGIGIYIHWTFWWLLLFFVVSDLPYGLEVAAWSVILLLAVFSCVFLHELGHAFSGRWFGVATRDITLLPIGGLARMEAIPPKPWPEFVIAICGPLVNIAIVLLLFPFLQWPESSDAKASISSLPFVTQLFLINLGLALFNMLPVYPMDGGRVLRAGLQCVMPRSSALKWTSRISQVLAIALIIYGITTGQWNLVLIFVIMLAICTLERFRQSVRERMGDILKQSWSEQQRSPYQPYEESISDSEVVDAETVRRVK